MNSWLSKAAHCSALESAALPRHTCNHGESARQSDECDTRRHASNHPRYRSQASPPEESGRSPALWVKGSKSLQIEARANAAQPHTHTHTRRFNAFGSRSQYEEHVEIIVFLEVAAHINPPLLFKPRPQNVNECVCFLVHATH